MGLKNKDKKFKVSSFREDVQDIVGVAPKSNFDNAIRLGLAVLCTVLSVGSFGVSLWGACEIDNLQEDKEAIIASANSTEKYIMDKRAYEDELYQKYQNNEITFQEMGKMIKEYSADRDISYSYLSKEEKANFDELNSKDEKSSSKFVGGFCCLFPSAIASYGLYSSYFDNKKKRQKYFEECEDIDYPHY